MSGGVQGNAGDGGRHLAWTRSSVLLPLVRRMAGEEGLNRLLELAGSTRSIAYLDDVTNWISLDESLALFKAASEITGDPQMARVGGEGPVPKQAGPRGPPFLPPRGSPGEVSR